MIDIVYRRINDPLLIDFCLIFGTCIFFFFFNQWILCLHELLTDKWLHLNPKEMLKGIFIEVKNKFETAMGILRKEKITIDPEDPAAVAQYAKVMKTVREK